MATLELRSPPTHVNAPRLLARIEALGRVGALEGGGVSRLALTDEDRAGRDLVVGWMRELGLEIRIDGIGNVVGLRAGTEPGPPVMTGSHIDTVRTGGLYDGNLGVIAGLEVIECLNERELRTRRPLAVGFFTNEEGARFAPDMMGSAVHQGALELEAMLDVRGIDGARLGDELARIGYAGEAPVGTETAEAFVELHIEQGPVLEREGLQIGAVTGVQGISWTEVTITGTSNHAGTTPMSMRADAGYAAAEIAVFVRRLVEDIGGAQVGTVGALQLAPNLVNVVAHRATLTVDLRNTDAEVLADAKARLSTFIEELARREGVAISTRVLADLAPVAFDPNVVELVERSARALGLSVRPLPSGAGHDAQMFAPNCPAGMVFVPSVGGLSHNVKEHTDPADLEAGANVLLRVLLELANAP